jgi:nitrate reductase gamma subunit
VAPDPLLGVPGDVTRAIGWVIVLAGALAFVLGSIARAIRYARQPMHLRWEVYPVPHESPARAWYGGSRYEETDWWTHPAQSNHWSAALAMAREILLLRGLWDANRPLWRRSYPFHLGLYLVVASTAALAAGGVWAIVTPDAAAVTVLSRVGELVGAWGLALSVAGAVALLRYRLTAPDLRPYTTAGDIVNLVAFAVAFGCLLAGVLTADSTGPRGVDVARAVLTIDTTVPASSLIVLGLALSALVAAYIPCTHMAHFVAKYFTYHAVRWDDAPNLGDGRIQRTIAAYLTYRPTWSATHVGADGTRTWADIATTPPPMQRATDTQRGGGRATTSAGVGTESQEHRR